MPRKPIAQWSWLLSLLVAVTACGSATPGAPEVPAESGEPAKPKDAMGIAASLVQGRISALVFVDRVKPHPVGAKLLNLGPAKDLLEGSKFDPLRDVTKAVVVSNNAREERAIVFAEHSVEAKLIPALVAELAGKSEPPGEVLAAAPNWTVKVAKKGREGVVCFLPPRFVVVLPVDLADRCSAFAETGGLPDPQGTEAAAIMVSEPADALRARGVPRIPPTVTALTATVVLNDGGGATIDAVGQSTTESAAADAANLTRGIDDATSISLGIVKIRAFGPVQFTPAEDKVKTHLDLSAAELDQILSLAETFIE